MYNDNNVLIIDMMVMKGQIAMFPSVDMDERIDCLTLPVLPHSHAAAPNCAAGARVEGEGLVLYLPHLCSPHGTVLVPISLPSPTIPPHRIPLLCAANFMCRVSNDASIYLFHEKSNYSLSASHFLGSNSSVTEISVKFVDSCVFGYSLVHVFTGAQSLYLHCLHPPTHSVIKTFLGHVRIINKTVTETHTQKRKERRLSPLHHK